MISLSHENSTSHALPINWFSVFRFRFPGTAAHEEVYRCTNSILIQTRSHFSWMRTVRSPAACALYEQV